MSFFFLGFSDNDNDNNINVFIAHRSLKWFYNFECFLISKASCLIAARHFVIVLPSIALLHSMPTGIHPSSQ